MLIRKYRDGDINQIVSLFYETVHAVNAHDYSLKQLDAWAPKIEMDAKLTNWRRSFAQNITYIAEISDEIVGFGDITPNGLLDRLYTHKDFQGRGIATALIKVLESVAKEQGILEIDIEASITAKPFFLSNGYQVLKSQTVERSGVSLNNFKMVKRLGKDSL